VDPEYALGHREVLTVIVRDSGSCWQVVLQTDHADLSAAFARQWAALDGRRDSLILATERHDDGWAVWEQAPRFDPAGQRPVNFLDVDISAHLAFYRAGIAAVSDQDPYAGLLVSMHGAGIYRQRYGSDPALSLTRVGETKEAIDAFVSEQEAAYGPRMEQIGVSEDERWRDYYLLQIYDRLSLYFCMRDVEAGESAVFGDYTLEPVEPWTVRITPFPFAEAPARFSLVRRLVPMRTWPAAEFAREFFALDSVSIPITILA
jgi:hypothetical protein